MGHLLDMVFDYIDAQYNLTHPGEEESAGAVRATGVEPIDRATTYTYMMAFGDLLRSRKMPTALDVHNRMAEVARNLTS